MSVGELINFLENYPIEYEVRILDDTGEVYTVDRNTIEVDHEDREVIL